VTKCLPTVKAPFVVNSGRLFPLAAAISLLVAGCGGPPPPPPPTVVDVQANAALDTNLTPDGQGAPVATRVYQLGSKSGLMGAEFFPIYKSDAATLGPDLIKKDEFLLVPGGSKTLNLTPQDPVHAIGVFAAYRDFQNTTWKAAADIPAHKTTTITITLDKAGVKLEAKPGKPASP